MADFTDLEIGYVQRYQAAAHAMQTGVAVEMARGSRETQPKHLRVGVNCTARDLGSLAGLLIEKGVITREEYLKALAEGMEAEVRSYQERIGGNVKLW